VRHALPGSPWTEQQKVAQAPFAKAAEVSPAQPLALYVGSFSNPVYGDLTTETDGRQLWLIAGPAKVKMMLIHRTHDTFMASQPGLDGFLGDSGFATFSFGGDGKVASVTLSEFADVDGGRFVAKPAAATEATKASDVNR
jgi:uncharacterized protein DUF3471